MARLNVALIVCLVVGGLSQFVSEEQLAERRRALDRKRPYKKFKKYLKCQVCEATAATIHGVWSKSKTNGGLDEDELFALVEHLCNPWHIIG